MYTYMHPSIHPSIYIHTYITIQYNTLHYTTVQYSTIPCNTIQYSTIQYDTIQYNTIQYNTIQYNTIHTYMRTCIGMYILLYMHIHVIHTCSYAWLSVCIYSNIHIQVHPCIRKKIPNLDRGACSRPRRCPGGGCSRGTGAARRASLAVKVARSLLKGDRGCIRGI